MYAELLAHIRTDFPSEEIQQSDWGTRMQEYLELLEQHKLLPYADEKYGSMLCSLREALLSNYRKIEIFCKELSNIASEAEVKIVFVKGNALNRCIYGDDIKHIGGDIDILVAKNDSVLLHKCLIKNGFRQRKGLSSVGIEPGTYERAVLAISKAHIVEENTFPLKRHSEKIEFLPYVKAGHPTVEVHDGLYFWSKELVNEALKDGCEIDPNGMCVLRPEYTFLLLLTNTYENSESFPGNSFDYGIVLRDYVDLRFFFQKYKDVLEWKLVLKKIKANGLEHIAAVVLGNLYKIYDKDVTYGCLVDIGTEESDWGLTVLERIENPELAKENAVRVMRKKWYEQGMTSVYTVAHEKYTNTYEMFKSCDCVAEVKYKISFFENALILSWKIPHDRVVDSERVLYQFIYLL